MGISQCNCEKQIPEVSFVELPTKYNEQQTKRAYLILQSFKFLLLLKDFRDKENLKYTQISESIIKESKAPDIKSFISKFKEIFEISKKILTKCDAKKYEIKILNQSEEDFEIIKSGLKEFYMNKIKEDQEFLLELNAFIDSKKIIPEEVEKTNKNRDSLGLNFGNLMKFIDKAKKFEFLERSSTTPSTGNLIKKVSFKVPLEIAVTKIEEEFNKLLDYKNPDNNSMLIEYFIHNRETYPQQLKNLISNIFSLKLMYIKFLPTTNNKFIQVNKKKIKNILRKTSKEDDCDKLDSIRKIKLEREEDNLKELSPSYEKLDLRKNVNPNEKSKHLPTNSNLPEKLISTESAEINNLITEKEEESHNFKKLQSKKTLTNSKENHRQKFRLKNIINSATIANNINTKLASQFYNGEICKNKQLYSGYGKLYKVNKKYIYYGTFKMGRKNGIGKIFQQLGENEYFYYGGEFTNNKMDGYGQSFHYVKQVKKIIITFREGTFHKNHFIKGEQILIQEEENILFEEYLGDFKNNQYSGKGKLKKKLLKLNKNNENKYEAEYEYEYSGDFLNNLENGNGSAKKNLKLLNYKYKYEGEFVNGFMEGIGNIKYEGNYYIESYEGIFEQDKTFCKYGRVKFKSGDEYEGFFENGKKAEVGIYFYKDRKNKGENFFGRFAEDNRDGIGRYNKPLENKVFAGKYIDGEKNGIFNLTYNLHSDNENKISLSMIESNRTNNFKNSFIPIVKENSVDGFRSTKEIKTELIKQMKIYYLFENDEEIDKSDKPIKE